MWSPIVTKGRFISILFTAFILAASVVGFVGIPSGNAQPADRLSVDSQPIEFSAADVEFVANALQGNCVPYGMHPSSLDDSYFYKASDLKFEVVRENRQLRLRQTGTRSHRRDGVVNRDLSLLGFSWNGCFEYCGTSDRASISHARGRREKPPIVIKASGRANEGSRYVVDSWVVHYESAGDFGSMLLICEQTPEFFEMLKRAGYRFDRYEELAAVLGFDPIEYNAANAASGGERIARETEVRKTEAERKAAEEAERKRREEAERRERVRLAEIARQKRLAEERRAAADLAERSDLMSDALEEAEARSGLSSKVSDILKKKKEELEEDEEYVRSYAVCGQTPFGTWQCDGPTQRVPLNDSDLGKMLSQAGCKTNPRRVRDIPGDRFARGCGFVFACDDPYEDYKRDIVEIWGLSLPYDGADPVADFPKCPVIGGSDFRSLGLPGPETIAAAAGADSADASKKAEEEEEDVTCPDGFSLAADGRSCEMSGYGCGACPTSSEKLTCGAYQGYLLGTASRCRIPARWSLDAINSDLPASYRPARMRNSGEFVCYAHGRTPACGDTKRHDNSQPGEVNWNIVISPKD